MNVNQYFWHQIQEVIRNAQLYCVYVIENKNYKLALKFSDLLEIYYTVENFHGGIKMSWNYHSINLVHCNLIITLSFTTRIWK